MPSAVSVRLFKPLDMEGVFIACQPAGVRLAHGHLSTGEVTPSWTWAAAPNAAGVGGVRAWLDDMVRYALAPTWGCSRRRLRPRLRRAQVPLAQGFDMNWFAGRFGGQDLVVHEGATSGFSSLMVMEPSAQRRLTLLVDTAMGARNRLAGPDPQLPLGVAGSGPTIQPWHHAFRVHEAVVRVHRDSARNRKRRWVALGDCTPPFPTPGDQARSQKSLR